MGPDSESKATRAVWLDKYGQIQIDVSDPQAVTARIDMVDWDTDCSVGTSSWCSSRGTSSILEDWNSDGTIDAIRQWADARKKNEEKEKEKEKPVKKGIIIKRVIFDGPATIVFWSDDTKTVVKCTEDDSYSYEVGIAMCTLKKIFGETYGMYRHDVRHAIDDAVIRAEKKEEHNKRLAEKDIRGLEKIVDGLKKAYGIEDEKK